MRHTERILMFFPAAVMLAILVGCARETAEVQDNLPATLHTATAPEDASPAVEAGDNADPITPAAPEEAKPPVPSASESPAQPPPASAPVKKPPVAAPAQQAPEPRPAAKTPEPATRPTPPPPPPAAAASTAAPPSQTGTAAAPAATTPPAGTVVIGTITVVSKVPHPSEVPYTECLTIIKYTVDTVENGEYGSKELLAAFWGMRNAKLEPAAGFKPGQRHRLVVEPLSKHPELTRVMQADDTNDYTLSPYWVISHTGA